MAQSGLQHRLEGSRWRLGLAAVCLTVAASAIPAADAPIDRVIAKSQVFDTDLVVPPNGSLTIHSGTELTFAADAGIVCRGSLIAEGTATHPIRLIASGAGGWRGILVLDSGKARLQRCRVSGAGGRPCWIDPASGLVTAMGSAPPGAAATTAGGALLILGPAFVRCEHCRFDHDHADYGGAMACLGAAAPAILSCRFDHDRAARDGGALYWSGAAGGSLTGCLIDANAAAIGAGARMVHGATPVLSACRLERNAATDQGGAVALAWDVKPIISECMIAGNTAVGHGSGISSMLDSTPVLKGNWFEDNADHDGTGPGLMASATIEGKVDHSTCAQDDAVNRDRVVARIARAGADKLEDLLADP